MSPGAASGTCCWPPHPRAAALAPPPAHAGSGRARGDGAAEALGERDGGHLEWLSPGARVGRVSSECISSNSLRHARTYARAVRRTHTHTHTPAAPVPHPSPKQGSRCNPRERVHKVSDTPPCLVGRGKDMGDGRTADRLPGGERAPNRRCTQDRQSGRPRTMHPRVSAVRRAAHQGRPPGRSARLRGRGVSLRWRLGA